MRLAYREPLATAMRRIDVKRIISVLMLTLITVAAFANNGKKPASKFSPDLKDDGRDIIVQFSVAPTAKHFSKVAALGGSLKAHHGFIHAASFHVPPGMAHKLANDPDGDVVYITPDRELDMKATTVNDFH